MVTINEKFNSVRRSEKVLQFGEGNFLRAFVDWQIDIANEKTDFNGNIVIVQPLEHNVTQRFKNQNCLYTTILRGIQHGKNFEETRVITSVSRCLNAYDDYEEYIKIAENPDLRFVVSNTTEAGIIYSPGCSLEDTPPKSFPAKCCQLLYKRFTFFKGSKESGLVFIPCELIEKNGQKLKEIVLQYADEWKLSKDFIKWINEDCIFCSSLVDRIVPGFPKSDAPVWWTKFGYEDNLLDQAEPFYLWVIETDSDIEKLKNELPLEKAGLNVIWTDDMTFYRTRKVRILNGTHSMFAAAAFMAGLNTVAESILNPVVYSFIKMGLFAEIIPSMDGDRDALFKYAYDILERFSNPYIKHQLLDICLNYSSKYKTRILPSIKAFYEKKGAVPQCLAFGIAAIIVYYNGKNVIDRSMTGNRDEESFVIKDDESVLHFFEDLYKSTNAPEKLAHAVLSNLDLWGEDLTKLGDLEKVVAHDIEEIQNRGMMAAMDSVRPTMF